MGELLNDLLEEFGVTSEEELLNNGVKDFYEKAKDGVFSYDELICLGYLDLDDVVKTIGIEKALSQGVISKEEAGQYKKESLSHAINLDEL